MKPKIALCFSGQTRGINNPNTPYRIDDWNEILDLFSDYDIDMYGHTWDDQETPDEQFGNFTIFKKTDQSIIWNTMNNLDNHQFWNFLPINPEMKKLKEYQDVLNQTGDSSFIDWSKWAINHTVGQVWSAQECFNYLKSTKINYDWVVRLRWDLSIPRKKVTDQGELVTWTENEIDFLKEQFRDVFRSSTIGPVGRFSKTKSQFSYQRPYDILTSDCLYSSGDSLGGNRFYINDLLFAIRGPVLKCDFNEEPIDMLSAVYRNHRTGSFPYAHSLWAQYLSTKHNTWLYSGLPDIVSVNSRTGPGDYDEHKKWGI